MKMSEAKKLARKLMDQHGVGHLTFRFNRAKRALGMCKYEYDANRHPVPKYIELSQHWVPHLSDAEVKDTILHEIAHAIAGHRAGHGPSWKAVARQVGANPARTAEEVPPEVARRVRQITAKYVARCTECDNEHYFNRLGKTWQRGGYRCGKCHGDFKIMQLR